MKKLFNLAYFVLMGLAAITFGACTDSYEYDPATVSGNQVFFDFNLPTTRNITTSASSFDVQIKRYVTNDAITVPLTVTKEAGSIFNVPASVSFAAGQAEATIPITYDPAAVVYGKYENLTLSVGDASYSTPYGVSTYTFSAGATMWKKMSGKATYREDLITGFYGVQNLTYNVDIEENIVQPGYYRLVNPYGPAWAYNDDKNFESISGDNYYMVINAVDPNFVYIEQFESGVELVGGDGPISFQSYIQYYLDSGQYTLDFLKTNASQYFGKLKDGVITMPAKTMLISEKNYNDGAWYTSNPNGLFAIAMPGSVIADYSCDFEYTGRLTDPTDQDFAEGVLTLGEDVASARYTLISAADSSYDPTNPGDDVPTITESGFISVPFDESGDYILVVSLYNAAKEYVGYAAFQLKLKSSKDNVEQFNPVAAGIFTLCARDLSAAVSQSGEAWGTLMEEPVPSEAILSQSTADPSRFMISPFFREGNDFYFTYDADANKCIVDGVDTGFQGQLSDGSAAHILCTDLETFFEQDLTGSALDSYFNADYGLYIFSLIYHDPGFNGYWACEMETYEVLEEVEQAAKKAFKKAADYQSWHMFSADKVHNDRLKPMPKPYKRANLVPFNGQF